MYILKILQKQSWVLLFVAGAGLVNSVLYSGLLIIISRSINGVLTEGGSTKAAGLLFLGLIVVSYFSRRLFQSQVIQLTNTLLFDFELSILQKLRRANLEAFQRIGMQRVYTAIGDAKTIAQVPRFFVDVTNSSVIILCGLGYLFWVSPLAALGTVLISALLMILYRVRSRTISPLFNRIRDLENDYYRYLQDLLHGFKEIKLNATRQENLYQKYIEKNRYEARNLEIQAASRYMNNELIGNYGWFLVVGIVTFVIPQLTQITTGDVTAFVVVILYLIGPLSALLAAIPFIARVSVSQTRLAEFNECVDAYIDHRSNNLTADESGELIDEITFENVEYSFTHKVSGIGFTFGQVNLTIRKGETLFITGKNGSGKSTFLMLLTGLLQPTRGVIRIDGRTLPDGLLSKQMAAVFVDAHLFTENYDDYDLRPTNTLLNEYATLLELTQQLDFDEAMNRLDSNLSKGQRKRLAMIYALLEQKPILVLDEWAAEQDPYFKHYFYETILPRLKAAGKTIIAVTHDDRYFDQADRVIQFENGKLKEDMHQLFGTLENHGIA